MKRSDKYVSLSNLSISHTWKNIEKSYKNNKSKTSAPTWSELELLGGLYSVSYIQDYFECILKKQGESTDNPLMRISINKIEHSIYYI